MSNRAPRHKVGRRTWIKVYCEEMLDGTSRFQFTGEQRAMWIDLLLLAGRSRYPGVVCAGETNGVFTPYPVEWMAHKLNYSPDSFRAALKMFEEQGRITVEDGVIKIGSWSRYQSEYQRQAPYRKWLSSEVTTQVTGKLLGETDKDRDKKQKESAPPSHLESDSDGDAAEQRKAAQAIRAAEAPLSQAQPDGLADCLIGSPPGGGLSPRKRPKGQVLVAQHEGYCRLCHEVIPAGEVIRWMGEKLSAHEACYAAKRGVPPEAPPVPVKAHPVGATERGLGLDDDAELASLTAMMREKVAKKGATV
jgi:hypothetical protein